MKDLKTFTVRINKDLWMFIKKKALVREMSMNELIVECLSKYQKKHENKLTEDDTMVS